MEFPSSGETMIPGQYEEGMDSVHIDISISKDGVPFLWRDQDPRSVFKPGTVAKNSVNPIMRFKPSSTLHNNKIC